ncbi:type II toxin-antitoxin system Phd/YefM family antitoxin [Endothiovibrio diazotrophicus]
MHEFSIAEAKNHLTRLIREVEEGEAVRITRRGKRAAVVLSEAEYQRLKRYEPEADLWATITAWRDTAQPSAEELSDEEIDGWRERTEGRAFSWEE